MYLATEACIHAIEWFGGQWGPVRGYGGPTVHGDTECRNGPPGPSVAAVHGPGGPSMAAALGPWGPIVGGPLLV